jgi:hypothetical protein
VRTLFWIALCCLPLAGETIVEQGIYQQLSVSAINPVAELGASFSGDFVFSAFNPALGQLNSVTIDWSAAEGAPEFYGSDAPYGTIVSFTDTQTATASLLGGPEGAQLLSSSSAIQSQSVSFPSGVYAEPTLVVPISLSGEVVLAPDNYNLNLFTYPFPELSTSVTVEDITPDISLYANPFDIYAIYQDDAGFSATLTYNYTPVPEPRTLCVLCILIAPPLIYTWRRAARR